MKRFLQQSVLLGTLLALNACGALPFATMLSGQTGGFANSTNGDVNGLEEEMINDGQIPEFTDDYYESEGAIPNNFEAEIDIDMGYGDFGLNKNGSSTYSTPGSAATPEGEMIDVDGDGNADVSTPHYTNDAGVPVDIPVPVAKDDPEGDGCTVANQGQVMMFMSSARSGQPLTGSSESGNNSDLTARSAAPNSTTTLRSAQIEIIANFNRNALPNTYTLQGTVASDNSEDSDDITGTTQPVVCEEQTDEAGAKTYTWQTYTGNDFFKDYEIVVGTVKNDNINTSQGALTLPLNNDGTFRIESAALEVTTSGLNYIGVQKKGTDTNLAPDSAVVLQNTGTEVRVDMTNDLLTYIDENRILTAPVIR